MYNIISLSCYFYSEIAKNFSRNWPDAISFNPLTMKKLLYTLLLSLLITPFINGCYYDNEEYLYPKLSCDTTNVTFIATVNPIIQSNCASCHSGAGAMGNIRLDSYTEISTYVANGRLMGSIEQRSGYRAMPDGLPKLDDCSIAKIRVWINAGYPNN